MNADDRQRQWRPCMPPRTPLLRTLQCDDSPKMAAIAPPRASEHVAMLMRTSKRISWLRALQLAATGENDNSQHRRTFTSTRNTEPWRQSALDFIK